MSFISELKDDFADVFCDLTEFGESIVYIEKQRDYLEATLAPGAGEKTISAVITRSDPNPSKSEGAHPFPTNGLWFRISKHTTKGIVAVNKGFDMVKIPIERDGSVVEMRVTKILSDSVSSWKLQAEE